MRMFHAAFNPRNGAKFSVGVNDAGETLVYLPGCPKNRLR